MNHDRFVSAGLAPVTRCSTVRPTKPFLRFFTAQPEQRLIGTMLACLMLLALPGCAGPSPRIAKLLRIPGLRGPDPAAALPADFNGQSSSESSAQIGLVEFFNDSILTDLITSGLAQNQELKIRNEEIQIANNEILARRGVYLPFLALGARGGLERHSKFMPIGAAEDQLTAPGGRRFSDPLGTTQLGANFFWRIDIWRQYRNAQLAAVQRFDEAVEDRNYLITRLVAETAENYYELASLDKRLVFLNQTIEIQKQSQEVAKAQKEAGRGTELPVQRFLAEVRKNESQKLIVAQRIIEVQNRINFLVGRFPQRVKREGWDFIKLDSSMLSVGVPAMLLQNRRDIVAAERELEATGLDILVARAEFYPKLDIAAGVGFEAFNPRFLFDPGSFVANAAGELVAPLVNRKGIQAEYMNANARQLQALYDYQRTVINAFTEVVNSMNKVQNYRGSVEIKQQQVRALEESVDVATNLFQSARAEYVDVLFSQRDLLEARTTLIETKQQQLSAIVKAYQALGGGYLLTSSGMEFPELFCPPWMQPGDMILPTDSTDLSVPGYELVSPPAGEEVPPPAGEEVAPPEDAAAPPAADEAGAPASKKESDLPDPADENLPPRLE